MVREGRRVVVPYKRDHAWAPSSQVEKRCPKQAQRKPKLRKKKKKPHSYPFSPSGQRRVQRKGSKLQKHANRTGPITHVPVMNTEEVFLLVTARLLFSSRPESDMAQSADCRLHGDNSTVRDSVATRL